MLKVFRECNALNHETFLMKILSHELIYEMNFSFLCEVIMLHRQVLQTCSCTIAMHAYVLIKARITVHHRLIHS